MGCCWMRQLIFAGNLKNVCCAASARPLCGKAVENGKNKIIYKRKHKIVY